MVWATLNDAKSNKKSLAILWLDLANAYGSVPHKLIEFVPRRYKVPDDWIELVLSYYDGLWGRLSSKGASEWVRYEVGIFAGCTVSVILFLAAFNLILEYVDRGDLEGYRLQERLTEVVRGFMDDISFLSPKVHTTRVWHEN